MSFRYFVIGSGSIGRRHAENLTTLGAEITHYGWRGIDLDAALSEIAACNGQAGVVIATATKVRLPLIMEVIILILSLKAPSLNILEKNLMILVI